MPWGFHFNHGPAKAAAKVGRPHRDRTQVKAARRARRR